MAQFNKDTQELNGQTKSLYEVMMLANKDGTVCDENSPLHVSLGSENVTITGDVNIGTTVEISNEQGNPIPTHAHIYDENDNEYTASNPLPVTPGNTDAFGRNRVSLPLTLFDSSHRFADNNLWSTATVTGGSTSFNASQGLVDLTVTTVANAEVVRETTKVFSYQPGKSLLVMSTFVPATPQTNLRQRIGYYGASNGMYYQLDGLTPAFVERSLVTGSVTETLISQTGGVYGAGDTGWNGDKLDGTGPSGLTLSKDKAQILWMDIEWLGLGSVRMGFVIDGQFIICHTFHHANRMSSTYITTASLPLRYEIKNTGVTAGGTLKQVCSTVISEGGYELRGLQQAVGTPILSPTNLADKGIYYPLISLKLKTTRLDAVVILTALSILGVGDGTYNWQVIASGSTTGGTWVSAGTDSSVEYNITPASITGGRILASGYIDSSKNNIGSIDILKEALFKFQLERNGLAGTPLELSIVATSDKDDKDVHASMDWEEISR